MRSILALSLLITLVVPLGASANAATVHHARHRHAVVPPNQGLVTDPASSWAYAPGGPQIQRPIGSSTTGAVSTLRRIGMLLRPLAGAAIATGSRREPESVDAHRASPRSRRHPARSWMTGHGADEARKPGLRPRFLLVRRDQFDFMMPLASKSL
jgi:hypothetical protein